MKHDKDYPRLQILTIEGLHNGTERIDAPPQPLLARQPSRLNLHPHRRRKPPATFSLTRQPIRSGAILRSPNSDTVIRSIMILVTTIVFSLQVNGTFAPASNTSAMISAERTTGCPIIFKRPWLTWLLSTFSRTMPALASRSTQAFIFKTTSLVTLSISRGRFS